MKEDKRLDDAFAASGLASQFKNAFKVGLDAYQNSASVMDKPLDEKALDCAHPDYIFDYSRNEHVCRSCHLNWRETGKSSETSDYIFDRLLGA